MEMKMDYILLYKSLGGEKMEYIIGAILAIIVIITVALILRKRLYDSVDYYEAWKLDAMNRNVAAELSKMKDLHLEGDARTSFETWKEQWENILTEDLATVEELLYDTEKAADKYGFATARKHMKEMESILLNTEEKIEAILNNVKELLDTEENNRQQIEAINPQVKELDKYLSQNRYQFSKADVRFEEEIDNIKSLIDTYHELVLNGDYLESTEEVRLAQTRLENIKKEMDDFPALYNKCKKELPNQVDELEHGMKEMVEQGYSINQTDLMMEIREFQSRLAEAVNTLEKDGTEEVKPLIPEIEERMKEIYDQLEEEAIAKNFVDTNVKSYEEALQAFEAMFVKTKSEVELLKQSYHFEEEDLEKFLTLENMTTQLREQLEAFEAKVAANNDTHSTLRNELEAAFADIRQLEEEHTLFKKNIENLRKDELEAREELQSMGQEMARVNRTLRNSNLPGVPNFVWSLLEEASMKNNQVLAVLDKEPLDIVEVQQSLTDAKATMEHAIDQTNQMLDQAFLTEQVIQYANRYRSSFSDLRIQLEEAERLFRKAEYELALENAARALEEIEPGALKRIESNQEQLVGS